MTAETNPRLGELSALSAQMRDAERAVEEADAALKARKADLRRIAEEDIPTLMAELGVSKLVLETGETVSVGLEVYAAIPEAAAAEAFKWLQDNGHGGMIKTVVSVHFNREEWENARALQTRLTDEGLEVDLDQKIHTGTLKSWLKEQLQSGANVPLDLFGARPVNLAKLKAARRTARDDD